MKSHIIEDVELKTTELKFRDKVYDVAFTLNVMKKFNKLDDDEDEIETLIYMITWLINDAIERKKMSTKEHIERVEREEVELFIGANNLGYYREIFNNVVKSSLPEDESEDSSEPKRTVTEDMLKLYGEDGENVEIKNLIAEQA